MSALPAVLQTLVDRFDASAFDAPAGQARIRLVVAEEGQWDALVAAERRPDRRRQSERRAPDATLTADRATWDRIAADLRGGMDAYRAGRLVVRHNLHLGVGFLAATSGATGPARLRFQRDRDGLGRAVDPDGRRRRAGPAPPRARRDQGLVPADGRGAGRLVPHDRARPARLRRLVQAARRAAITRRSSRASVVELMDALGLDAGARDRQQHGRARRARARPAIPRARRTAGACWRRRWPGDASGRGRRSCAC